MSPRPTTNCSDYKQPSPSQLGLLNAIWPVGSLVALPFVPYTADILGRRAGVMFNHAWWGCASKSGFYFCDVCERAILHRFWSRYRPWIITTFDHRISPSSTSRDLHCDL
jgi:hypothetical protein